MKITFDKHTVAVSARYACRCGHKFTRKNSDWFTINPWNNKPYDQLMREYSEKVKTRKRTCPKCQAELCPLDSPEEK